MAINYTDIKKFHKVLVIYNRNSGKQFFASMLSKMNEVLKLLKLQFGAKNVELREFKRFAEFSEIIAKAAEEQVEWVIIAGGDGTIRAVVEEMFKQQYDPFISVFPAGTVNLIAKELQLTTDPYKWISRIFKGVERPVYLGKCNGSIFLTVAGAGFESLVVDRVTELEKKLFSKFAYVLQGTETMRKELLFNNWRYEFQVRFDDEKEWQDASSVLVGKSRYYAGRYNIFPEAALNKPYLFTALFKGNSRSDFCRYAALLALENLTLDKDVVIRQSSKVEIRCNVENFPAELDGDAVAETPLQLEIIDKPLKFLA